MVNFVVGLARLGLNTEQFKGSSFKRPFPHSSSILNQQPSLWLSWLRELKKGHRRSRLWNKKKQMSKPLSPSKSKSRAFTFSLPRKNENEKKLRLFCESFFLLSKKVFVAVDRPCADFLLQGHTLHFQWIKPGQVFRPIFPSLEGQELKALRVCNLKLLNDNVKIVRGRGSFNDEIVVA